VPKERNQALILNCGVPLVLQFNHCKFICPIYPCMWITFQSLIGLFICLAICKQNLMMSLCTRKYFSIMILNVIEYCPGGTHISFCA